MKQLRALVVDDSGVFRKLIAECINTSGTARVVAHAADGHEALAKMVDFSPDLVTIDLEMPGLGGLDTIRAIKERAPKTAVVVVSSFTAKGAASSMRALELGAHDVITKPETGDASKNRAELAQSLQAMLQGILFAQSPPPPSLGAARRRAPTALPQIVAIGSSTGGPAALAVIVPRLPASLPVPVVIAQHMPPLFTASLAATLAEKSQVRVVEARHGDALQPGVVYIAPGGRHLKIASTGGVERHCELTDDPPEHYCRPAVDYLFRSIAETYRENALGVILTGMGKDGTLGLRVMRRFPVYVIGQSAESCTVYGMPREAMNAGCVDEELPAERIADAITTRVTPRGR